GCQAKKTVLAAKSLLALDGALGAGMPFGLVVHFVQSDGDQEPPQVVAMLRMVVAVAGMGEETAIGRLNDVFGIDALVEAIGKPATDQLDESSRVALKQCRRGLLVSLAPLGHQIGGIVFGHPHSSMPNQMHF